MDLVAGIEVADVERKLREYARENQDSIKENARVEEAVKERVEEDERARVERSEMANAEAWREYREELAEREAGRKEVVDKILNANSDVLRVAREAERTLQKRATAKHQLPTSKDSDSISGTAKSTGFAISGLRKAQREIKEPNKVYDPFDGLVLQFKYYSLAQSYYHPWSNTADKEKGHASGGASAWEYQRRSQMDAHAGLGVFVAEEKA